MRSCARSRSTCSSHRRGADIDIGSYAITPSVDAPFERVISVLAAERFGVLTTIDVRETLKKKVEVEPYVILGASRRAVATILVVVTDLSAVGFAEHLLAGSHVAWATTLPFAAAAILTASAGAAIGSRLRRRARSHDLAPPRRRRDLPARLRRRDWRPATRIRPDAPAA